jgi:Protein of unknown function (DUF3631)
VNAGLDLLDALRGAITRYVILPSPEGADAVTAWIAATHAQPAWEHATRLVIKSPEKRCGKSRLLDVAEATCHDPLITVNISPARLVRSIDDDPPTILLDEADAVFGRKAAESHEDLRGILNAGHQRNRPYLRWDATARRGEDCPTFAMAALAGIGDMPDTIEDRAVIISMRRRAPGESVMPFRTRRDAPPLNILRDQLCTWVRCRLDKLTTATPDMPVEDRAADTWEPLCAIADVAGGDWPARIRKATLVLTAAASEADMEASLGLRLLADIRAVFDSPFMASAELVSRLHNVDDAPWADFDLTTRRLAARLRGYGIKAGHNAAKTARGYRLEDFSDAFARYLASAPVQTSETYAEQREPTDAYEATDDPGRPARNERPRIPAGQVMFTDAGTLPGAGVPEHAACTECRGPLDRVLVSIGETTHPGCDPQPGSDRHRDARQPPARRAHS